MRALKLIGLADDGASLVCEEPNSGELFAVPADDRLRTAAGRGITLKQQTHSGGRTERRESDMEPQLRPREIQSRIRAGASLDEVAELAGCEVARIERFAYPVLMERSAVADRAVKATPIVAGSPAGGSVSQLVTATLASRGQDASMRWDAYRSESGPWVLLLIWTAGRSENTARWTYHQSGSNGTVTALDDAASEVMDPAPRPLRTVREPVIEEPVAPVNPLVLQQHEVEAPVSRPQPARPATTVQTPNRPTGTNKVAAALAHHAVTSPATEAVGAAQPSAARTGTEDSGARRARPPMPSWEDVLLGVRSNGR